MSRHHEMIIVFRYFKTKLFFYILLIRKIVKSNFLNIFVNEPLP